MVELKRGSVSIVPDPSANGQVVIRPTSYLEVAEFTAFKAACMNGGATYEADDVTNRTLQRAAMEAVPHLLDSLQKAGFSVGLDQTVYNFMYTRAERAEMAAKDAERRIDAINEELAKRGETLWRYQGFGVIALAEHSPGGFGLFDAAGLGKTVEALLALKPGMPAIVVTQASIIGEWERAIARWLPERQVVSYEGRGSLKYWPKGSEIGIASYDCMAVPITDPPSGLVVILDEAHNFANPQAARTKRWNKFRDKVFGGGGTIWLLTGTPLLNNLKELWTVLQLAGLGEEAFLTRQRFAKMATEDPAAFGQRMKTVSLRRLKREVLQDLPPKVHQRVDAKITDEDRKELDAALKRMVDLAIERAAERGKQEAAMVAPGDRNIEQALVDQYKHEAAENVRDAIDLAFNGKIQVPFELIARVKSILALAKSRRSMELLDEVESNGDGSPLLFFSAHLEPVKAAASRNGWESLTGGTDIPDRKDLVESFQSGKLRGLALTIKAGGTGLNLQRAHVIVRNDREWTPARNEQADDRAHRAGQTESVHIFDVVADHVIDQRISDLLDEKQALIDSTVEQAVTRMNEERKTVGQSIKAQLATTTNVTTRPIERAWAPETDDERDALAWAKSQSGEFFDAVKFYVNRPGGGKLIETTWKILKQRYQAHQRQIDEHKHRQRLWVVRSLRLMDGRDPAPLGIRIDGPTRSDATIVKELLERTMTAAPDDAVWSESKTLLVKYRRQIGDAP